MYKHLGRYINHIYAFTLKHVLNHPAKRYRTSI